MLTKIIIPTFQRLFKKWKNCYLVKALRGIKRLAVIQVQLHLLGIFRGLQMDAPSMAV